MNFKKSVQSILWAVLYFGIYEGMQMLISTIGMDVILLIVKNRITLEEAGGSAEQYRDIVVKRALDLYNEKIALMTVLSGALTLLVILLIAKIVKHEPFSYIGIRKVKPKEVGLLFLYGAVFCAAISFILVLIPFPESWLAEYEEESSVLFDIPAWQTFLSSVIMAPLVEETVFRGLIYRSLSRGIPRAVAMVLVSVLFGYLHGTVYWMIYAGVLGLFLVWIYEKFNSTLASMAVHCGFNLVGSFLISYLPVSIFLILLCFLATVVLTVHFAQFAPVKIDYLHCYRDLLPDTDDETKK